MSFSDIFKSTFLEKTTAVTATDMGIALALSFVLGLFIYFVYKKTYSGVMYSRTFGISLLGLSMITTLVILAVTSNVVLSLGMVGALSIVRFRTAIKEPMDIVFLFWAIAGGIVLGAGMIPLALVGSAIIGLILVLFVNKKPTDAPYMLILQLTEEVDEPELLKKVDSVTTRRVLKSKTVTDMGSEATFEVRIKDASAAFVRDLKAVPGVRNATLVAYNGEYMQ